jgi:hypothetical protein
MHNHTDMPSDRSFGWMVTIVCLLVAAYLMFWKNSPTLAAALLVASVVMLLITLKAPAVLRPFSRAWFKLGLLLGSIVNPIVMGFLFFVLITPLSLFMRATGRDVLRLKKTGATSHWVPRSKDDLEASSFKNQF